jgi:hypothetical protein
MTIPEVQVGAKGDKTIGGELAGSLPVPIIPPRQVMYEYHPGEGSRTERAGKISVDQVCVVSWQDHCLSQHTFILVSCNHEKLLGNEMITIDIYKWSLVFSHWFSLKSITKIQA